MAESLVVVLVIDKLNVSAHKTERDTPVSVYPYRPMCFQIAFQGVQLVARLIEFGRCSSRIEHRENAPKFWGVSGLHAPRRIFTKKGLEPFVPETDYHGISVARYATRHKNIDKRPATNQAARRGELLSFAAPQNPPKP